MEAKFCFFLRFPEYRVFLWIETNITNRDSFKTIFVFLQGIKGMVS